MKKIILLLSSIIILTIGLSDSCDGLGELRNYVLAPAGNYSEVSDYCNDLGGSLAIINSYEEHLETTQAAFGDCTSNCDSYWIGLNDINIESELMWVDGSDYYTSSYQFFNIGWQTDDRDCFFYLGLYAFMASAVVEGQACSQNFPGICEIPPDNPVCDCEGNTFDCAGVCGGNAVVDECGICNGSSIAEGACGCPECSDNDDGVYPLTCADLVDNGGCDLNWGGASILDHCPSSCGACPEEDECGVCEGDGSSCACTPNGDTNGDMNINVTDIVLIIESILNGTISDELICSSDVNSDGAVDVADIVAIVESIIN